MTLSVQRPASSRLRVLLVEDTAGFSNLFDDWLKDAELEVHVAASGLDAASRLSTIPYDLAFIDVHLPDLDAVGVVRLAASAGGQMPRVYAITGDGREETRRACLDAGFIDVLVKPILRSRFVELVEVEKLRRDVFG